jgi:hypothetical protein
MRQAGSRNMPIRFGAKTARSLMTLSNLPLAERIETTIFHQ